MKIAFTDIETTGVYPEIHEIISIGCVIFDSETLEVVSFFDAKIGPVHLETASPEALKINGYTQEGWKDAYTLKSVLRAYCDQAKDCIFAAHNVLFDYSFILEGCKQSNIMPTFDRHKIDLLSIAWAKIPHDKIEKWSLKSICEYLGIPPEPEIHTALNGAMTGFEVYKKLMQIDGNK
jgi:DNA polymerase III epsilon subunit-like protein